MYCKYCGQALQPGCQFCPRCGKQQTAPSGVSSGGWSTSSEWFQGWEPLLYIACIFFQVFAIIVWAMYHQSPAPRTRNFVRNCVISAIAGFVLLVAGPVILQMVFGVAMMSLLHGASHPPPGIP